MQTLLDVKAEQCEQFRICLMENQGKLLAEATPSKFWATGLSPYVTEHTSPQYWPGQNMLGAFLMELSRKLFSITDPQVIPLVVSQPSAEVIEEENTPTAEAIEATLASEKSEGGEIELEMATEKKTEDKLEQTMEAASSHKSRPQSRTPPGSRPPRSFSTPHRRIRSSSQHGVSPHGKKNALKELSTPKSMDIRQIFKRKTLASSPAGEVDNTKVQKPDGQDVT